MKKLFTLVCFVLALGGINVSAMETYDFQELCMALGKGGPWAVNDGGDAGFTIGDATMHYLGDYTEQGFEWNQRFAYEYVDGRGKFTMRNKNNAKDKTCGIFSWDYAHKFSILGLKNGDKVTITIGDGTVAFVSTNVEESIEEGANVTSNQTYTISTTEDETRLDIEMAKASLIAKIVIEPYGEETVPVITLTKSTLALVPGATAKVTASVDPSSMSVKWKSSNETVATVEDGTITAAAAGEAEITCYWESEISDKTAEASLIVTVAEVTLNEEEAVKTYDFTTMGDVTLTTGDEAGEIYNAANSKNNKVFYCTNEGLENLAVQAVYDNGRGWSIVDGKGLFEGASAGRCAAIAGIAEGQVVEFFYTGSDFYTKSDGSDDGIIKTALNEEVGRAIYKAEADGMIGFELIKGNYITKINIYNVDANDEPQEGEETVTVKMTYVDYDTPDTSYGEIVAGETAKAGYNKIGNGEVGFGNTSWSCNWITYLQVDGSAIPGTITKATLTFEGSGSTDSKRTTGWGVGYNSSVWSSDMTYNTADKSITTLGTEQWTATKSATVFESFEFDITEALKNAEGKVATILVYETAAAGGYIKNPTVTISYTTAKTYAVTFAETNGVEATVTINGSDVTNGTSLPNGTYEFTATAAGYKDYAGEFTIEGADKAVEFTMAEKAIYSYTVKGVDSEGNELGVVNKGTGYEEESVTYYYPEFVLDGTILYKKNSNGSNPYWGATGLLDVDNKEFTVTYGDDIISDVVFYTEAEDIEGFTAKTTNNATIRCSNGTGGIVDGTVLLTTLPAGKYQIFGQVWGTTGLTAAVLNDEGVEFWTLESTGSLENKTSDEFELNASTDLYIYTAGGNDNHMLDLIYIVRTGDVATGINTVNAQTENGAIYNLQGQKVQKAQKGLYIVGGKKVLVK